MLKLEYLNLDFNDLSSLPEETLPLMSSLRSLHLCSNYLTHLPELVVSMASLVELAVVPNPLIQPPVEDCERGLEGMRRYYYGLRREKERSDDRAVKRMRAVRRRKVKIGSPPPEVLPPLPSQSPLVIAAHAEPPPSQASAVPDLFVPQPATDIPFASEGHAPSMVDVQSNSVSFGPMLLLCCLFLS